MLTNYSLFAINVVMSDLATYLAAAGTSQRSFAEEIRCSQSFLSDILSGRRRPSLGLAARIERATKGQIKAVSWVSDEAPR